MLKYYFVGINNHGALVSISAVKNGAMEECLRRNKYRWTYQTIKKDWEYLEKDGWKIKRARIILL